VWARVVALALQGLKSKHGELDAEPAGARVKVMRCFGVGPVVPISRCGRQMFDFGAGANLDLTGDGLSFVVCSHPLWPRRLELCVTAAPHCGASLPDAHMACMHAGPPTASQCALHSLRRRTRVTCIDTHACMQARLRLAEAIRLHLAPQPVFKLKHAFPLWRSGLCLHAEYLQALNSRTFQNLGKQGAVLGLLALPSEMRLKCLRATATVLPLPAYGVVASGLQRSDGMQSGSTSAAVMGQQPGFRAAVQGGPCWVQGDPFWLQSGSCWVQHDPGCSDIHAGYSVMHGAGTWRIGLGRTGDNELIVSPDRVELSNARMYLGPNILLHISGELNYPRFAPDPDWQDRFSFLPSRVCIKVGW
jgi:hypothetical protein